MLALRYELKDGLAVVKTQNPKNGKIKWTIMAKRMGKQRPKELKFVIPIEDPRFRPKSKMFMMFYSLGI